MHQYKVKDTGLFSNTFQAVMFSHTTLRNVGLYTSISFAAIALVARLRNKNQSVSSIFVLLGALVFLAISYKLNAMLYATMEKETRKIKGEVPESIKTTQAISSVLIPVHYILMIIVFVGLYRAVRSYF